MVHSARELGSGLLIVSEPNHIPDSPEWFASVDQGAAIFADVNTVRLRCSLAVRGSRFVAVNCGSYLVISIYAPPSIDLFEFNVLLDELSGVLSSRVERIILAGDFNAKARAWGAKATDHRGLLLTRWAAERDLRIVNEGQSPTCVRPQGQLIIDLTWVSPDLLQRVVNWRVRSDMESLSDHCFITFEVETGWKRPPPNHTAQRRWNSKKFDSDLFRASLIWRAGNPTLEDPMDIVQVARWLDLSMEKACDVAAPRIGPRRPRRKTYWWSKLSWEIGRRKSAAWQELLGSVDKDPWGLPYRLVLKNLRTTSLGLTEVLEPETLSELLESLFPPNNRPDPIVDWSDFVWDNMWATSPTEVNEAIRKATSSWTKAPGPDGLKMAVWRQSTREFLHWISHLFNLCLMKGEFPSKWKGANLVLIPKESTPSAGLP
ncbi:reverse transcriptase [Lasius niger]|uniref:Reverse transcriptase n=1 Tax=Lasius niger TaxID=67767 RepID=A0A0J7KPQ7_LASNI|nr:reverse transcriptase [Lasius niger]